MDVERLFADFCRTREPALLGGVFDACADDLFAVALHLCRDRVDAEAGASVSLAQQPTVDPFGRAWQGEAGADGCIELRDVVPGAFKVYARATPGAERAATADTVVHPGQASAVQIVLPN